MDHILDNKRVGCDHAATPCMHGRLHGCLRYMHMEIHVYGETLPGKQQMAFREAKKLPGVVTLSLYP